MGRPKKSAPKHVEPEDTSQEVPDVEPAFTLESKPLPQGAVSQSDAARAALDAGHDKPAEAVKYIKATFGIDMDPQYFSAIKSRSKPKEAAPKKAEPAKRGRKPKAAVPAAAAPAVVQPAATPKAAPVANGQLDLLDALTAMKPLIAHYGADQVKKMVDLLG